MYSLLVADDKEIFCRSILQMDYFSNSLCRFHVVHTARNGIEALEYLKKNPVDIVMTDIRMPMMDGLELLKAIQSRRLCRCVILLSEYRDFSYAKEGIINGAFDYLVKPIDDAALGQALERAADFLQQHDREEETDSSVAVLCRLAAEKDEVQLCAAIENVLALAAESSDSMEDEIRFLEKALGRLQAAVSADFPYMADYIPLSRLCTRLLWPADAPGRADLFTSTILFLYRARRRFCTDSAHSLILNVWYYVLENIDEPCRLQSMADLFFVNKNYLSTLFKQETGIYYKDFVLNLKIERAKMLISYSDLKIYHIAEKLHFRDGEYFSRIFKAKTGMAPSRFSYEAYLAAQLNLPRL